MFIKLSTDHLNPEKKVRVNFNKINGYHSSDNEPGFNTYIDSEYSSFYAIETPEEIDRLIKEAINISSGEDQAERLNESILDQGIRTLDLSMTSYNFLSEEGIKVIKDLILYTSQELYEKNKSLNTLVEIRNALAKYNLTLRAAK